MASLIKVVRDKFLDAIRSIKPPEMWKDLVVDAHARRLLFAVLKNNEVLAERITGVEDIAASRGPQPNREAMYLLMPTTQNVERLIAEFEGGRRQYARVHLFFVEGLSEELFGRLGSSPAEPFLACLQELFVNFRAIESQVFSTQEPEQFFSLYSPLRSPGDARPQRDKLLEDLRFTSKVITNVCIALDEFPYIRYYHPPHHPPLGALAPNATMLPPPPPEGSGRWRTDLARGARAREYEAAENEHVPHVLARLVQESLEEYQRVNKDFPKPTPGRPRGTLIVTDRSMDVLAPFVHEFTYQAMAKDLLSITDDNKYTYQIQNEKGLLEDMAVVLNDEDAVWSTVRHMHIREAIDKLIADFNEFMQKHAGFTGEGAADLDTMKDMLASLPEYKDQRAKFSLHLNVAQQCMDTFEKRQLTAVANVEQNCATGVTAEGKTPKTLVEEMVPLLDSRNVSNRDKARIVALYIQYREGVPVEDRRRLYQHARLSMAEQDAINGLAYLGVRITRGPADKDQKKRIKARPSTDDYELSRFKPALEGVLDDEVSNRLDQSLFPYIADTPAKVSSAMSLRHQPPPPPKTTSLRSAKPNWHRPAQPGGAAKEVVRQRLLVFVAGGMTYSEMRTAYQRSAALGKDVYIGSTHTITPERFIDDLKVLELGGVGSRALYDGLRGRGGPSPSYQAFYDKKYFVPDTPAPVPDRPSSVPAKGDGGSRLVAPRLQSSRSFQSTDSTGSKETEKKKKGRFFKF